MMGVKVMMERANSLSVHEAIPIFWWDGTIPVFWWDVGALYQSGGGLSIA
jgi:hypothetical protein